MTELMFTPLESKVLEWLLEGEEPILNLLRKQLYLSRIKSRQYTGVGIYLYFDVPHTDEIHFRSLRTRPSFCFGDVDALLVSGNDQIMVGFLLWVENGYLVSLEGYTYGLEKWPESIDKFFLNYMNGERDLDELKRNWQL